MMDITPDQLDAIHALTTAIDSLTVDDCECSHTKRITISGLCYAIEAVLKEIE